MSFDGVECVLQAEAVVGESPVWCAREQSLYWVDITGQKIHRFHPNNGSNDTFHLLHSATCDQIVRTPLSGSLFAVTPGIRGLAANYFAG